MSLRHDKPPALKNLEKQNQTVKYEVDRTRIYVYALTFIIIVAVFAWIIYSMISESNAQPVNNVCPVGACSFNVLTGVKKCPAPGDTKPIVIALGAESCTSKDYCQQSQYRCAVLANQTLDCNGVCGPSNSGCRCVASPFQ